MAEGSYRHYPPNDHKSFYGDAEAYQAMQQGQHLQAHPHSLQSVGFDAAGSFHQQYHHYPPMPAEHNQHAGLQHPADGHMEHAQNSFHPSHMQLAEGATPPMSGQQGSQQRQHHQQQQQMPQQLMQHSQNSQHQGSMPQHPNHHQHPSHAMATQGSAHSQGSGQLQMAQSPLGLQHLQAAHQQAQHLTPPHGMHSQQQMQGQHGHSMPPMQNAHSTPQPQQSPAGMPPNRSMSPGLAMTPPPVGTRFSHATLEDLRHEQAQFVAERDMDRLQSPRNLLFSLMSEVGGLSQVFQWRGDSVARGLPSFSPTERGSISDTLSEVLFVLVRLSDACGVDLAASAHHKLQKNSHKFPADRSRGVSSMDHYSRPRMMMKEDALDPTGGKRKRFTEDQLNALQKLAEEAQWSLVSVPREARDKFCSEWDITKERLHNFFNNRKPKDLKKARSRLPESSSQDNPGDEPGQAEFNSM